ncbi:helix-turn-helix domain-containing protein [Cohnella sp. GCM10027633]|uniref:helix-turn-helix transcriptional regulator n=1 Tax=unclassified Cohnella TaxID=2636738 RepID=UPI0036347C04
MDCLELNYPPLPQFMTVGHSVWQPGMQHFERTFNVYDLLFVRTGTLYMREENTEYAIGSGDLLVLEAGKPHAGYRPCEEDTEVYWVHFLHEGGSRLVDNRQIVWNAVLPAGTDADSSPRQYAMYLPKWAKFDAALVVPVLDRMIAASRSLDVRNGLALHAGLTDLLVALQQGLRPESKASPSLLLSRKLEAYLRERAREPYADIRLEREFHFNAEYLSRCLKKHTGMTPTQYVHYWKIEEAKKLLAATSMPVPLIAETVGVSDYNYFIRLFRAKTGATPGQYRSSRLGLT